MSGPKASAGLLWVGGLAILLASALVALSAIAERVPEAAPGWPTAAPYPTWPAALVVVVATGTATPRPTATTEPRATEPGLPACEDDPAAPLCRWATATPMPPATPSPWPTCATPASGQVCERR